MTGWLAQRFGRKRILMMAVFGFTCASFMCGLAPNLATLIVFRVIQGASGGTMQPLSQAIMLEAFPPEERGKAMAALGGLHRDCPDSGTGRWRMADRHIQLALDFLHQHTGRNPFVDHGQDVCLRSVLPAQKGAEHRLLGNRNAGGRDSGAADYSRQRSAGGLVLIAHDYHAGGNRGCAAPCIRPL